MNELFDFTKKKNKNENYRTTRKLKHGMLIRNYLFSMISITPFCV